MLSALREEIVRWDGELERSPESGGSSYTEYCELILAQLHDKCGQLEWVLNDKTRT